jgi:uncharacterized membrane protein YoaK (UPF0700 family)
MNKPRVTTICACLALFILGLDIGLHAFPITSAAHFVAAMASVTACAGAIVAIFNTLRGAQ